MAAGTKGLLKVAVKPVNVGVKDVTVRPRTAMAVLVPEMMGLTDKESVAVIVWLPAVFSVTAKTLTPPVRVESAGRLALASLLVKCTWPP